MSPISLSRCHNYFYGTLLHSLREHRIDQALKNQQLIRGSATAVGNNCLLDTLYQQLIPYLQDRDFSTFVQEIRERIGRTDSEMLSINDELEGIQILSAIQALLGNSYDFQLSVWFADTDGDLAPVDMTEIQGQINDGNRPSVSIRMVLVNYNHYQPLFSAQDPSAQMAQLSLNQRNLPAYVVNMPFKVDSDEEGDSSDGEEETGKFPLTAFYNPAEWFRMLPKEETKRGTVQAVMIPGEECPLKKKGVFASTLLPRFEREEHFSHLSGRIGIHVGYNKMRSLSRRRNRALFASLNEPIKSKIPIRKTAFFWDGVWQKRAVANGPWITCSYDEVRTFYSQLKRKNRHKAKAFRVEMEKGRSHMVPYREIRDVIKNHEATRSLTRLFQQRQAYLVFLDSDLRSFHRYVGAPGAFSVFDENFLSRNFTICTTGYTIREPNNLGLEIGVLADMSVRQATANHIARGPYYPEPCTAVAILPGQETVLENFSDPRAPNYSFPQEMPRLISAIIKIRQLDPEKAMCMDSRGSIVTTTPHRMQRQFSCRSSSKNGIILWELSDFRTMRGINQTHYNSRDWACNLLRALQLQQVAFNVSSQAVLRNVAISLLSRLFNAYDPVDLAERTAHSTNPFQTSMILTLKNYDAIDKETIPPAYRAKSAAIWDFVDPLTTTTQVVSALDALIVGNRGESLRSAAKESGKAVADLLKKRLCLNYSELVLFTLAELIGVARPILEAKMPPVYLEIIRSNSSVSKREIRSIDVNQVYGLTPLHIVALAGNLELIKWLRVEFDCDLQIEDGRRWIPLNYALIHCEKNGINLDLIKALCDEEMIGDLQEMICEFMDNVEDQAYILDDLLKEFGPNVIQEFKDDLFIYAILNDYEEIAKEMSGLDDYSSCIQDAILELAPRVDRRLMKWAMEEDIAWAEGELGETESMLFRLNRGADEDFSDYDSFDED
ncbi:MAG: hypothetical protein JSS61_06285 [Verrucomicrobia bacterium]|nr:hypothetical protein [Verrucomicrobiota bacterium]